MGIPRDKNINLFEDVRDDGYEYGWEQFPEYTTYKEKHVEIRRKIGSGIDDDWEFKWNGEWWTEDRVEEVYPDVSDLPDELLNLSFALVNNIEFEMDIADDFKTHNSRQIFASSGKSLATVLEEMRTQTSEHSNC